MNALERYPVYVTYDQDEIELEDSVMEAMKNLTEARFSVLANRVGARNRWLAIGRAVNRLVARGKLEQIGDPNDMDNPVRYRIKK